MDAVACPFVAHQLQDLDPLLEMQVLLGGYNAAAMSLVMYKVDPSDFWMRAGVRP